MKAFTDLFIQLDQTTSTLVKVKALAEYFRVASDQDKLWTIAIFSHKRPKRTVTTSLLRIWAAEAASIPDWLFEDTYHIVGDLAETIAKIVPEQHTDQDENSLTYWIEYIIGLEGKEEKVKKSMILSAWKALDSNSRFLFNKIITGGFRIGVSQKTMVKALSKYLEQDEAVLAHKLMGNWTPLTTSFEALLLSENLEANQSRPYPFYLAYALDKELKDLGEASEWYAEYKWDGIRGQIIKREGKVYVWSRGEELVTPQYPEFEILSSVEMDFVLDGELIVMHEAKIASFDNIQKRIGRRKPGKKILKDYPVVMMVYDLLELNGEDLRSQPQQMRRQKLEALMPALQATDKIFLSSLIDYNDWDQLREIRKGARAAMAEGLMLKAKAGEYRVGRKKGAWFKWKLDPLVIDAVMLYAQRGHGRRANWFTDFTFALKDGNKLVPFAKAYSGLTDAEFLEITKWVKKNTKERFGPVSSVTPKLVFELAFEGVMHSSRHKSGLAVRFPRIKRWRKDKQVEEINTLQDLKTFIF